MAWVLAAVASAFLWGRDAVNYVADFTERRRRLSRGPAIAADNQVHEAPELLRAQAEATLGREVKIDAYAIARMLRSEGGNGAPAEKQARAWVARNDAAAHGWSMLYTIAGPDGLFGRQRGWRYASGEDPYENDLAIAEAVLGGQLPDNTGGAVKFVDVGSFGKQAGSGSYEATREAWSREGLSPRTVPGTADDFRVFVRDGGKTNEA